jgi:hypothetical protein
MRLVLLCDGDGGGAGGGSARRGNIASAGGSDRWPHAITSTNTTRHIPRSLQLGDGFANRS